MVESKQVSSIPHICKAWTMLSPPAFCMYTSLVFKEDASSTGAFLLSDWERKHCPWWLDMKKGTFIEEEKNLFEKHSKGECRSESGSIGNINDEDRRRLEEEQKKLLDQRGRVDGEAQGYKGRPKNKNLDTPAIGNLVWGYILFYFA